MGLHEYRPPTALGGVTPAYIYRDDLAWLAAEAAEASRWMSRPDRPVHVDAADVLHAIIEAHRGQGQLALRAREGRGDEFPRLPGLRAGPVRESPTRGFPRVRH